jgi:hypothetical protein
LLKALADARPQAANVLRVRRCRHQRANQNKQHVFHIASTIQRISNTEQCSLINSGACRQHQRRNLAGAGNGSLNMPRFYGQPS